MKAKFGNFALGSIQELSKAQQKGVKGGGPNSPCCPNSPYYNYASCQAYLQCPQCEHYNCG